MLYIIYIIYNNIYYISSLYSDDILCPSKSECCKLTQLPILMPILVEQQSFRLCKALLISGIFCHKLKYNMW